MTGITRRRWLTGGLGAAGLALAAGRATAAGRGPDVPALGLPAVGAMPVRPSHEIEASPLGVGFEVLDRKIFNPHRATPWVGHLGVKWARCQTGWARTETTEGEYDFGWLDDVVDGLLAVGVQPWFNLGYGNPLYSPGADEAAVGWAPVFDEAARQAWVRYTRAIAGHFAGRVRHWEIWNEPNISHFWKPKKPDPADYVDLVTITAPEIRRRVPDAVIVGCATAGVDTRFVRGCLERGLAEHVDKVTYHPYRRRPEAGYRDQVTALREALAAHKKGIEIWQGENGCPSRRGGSGALSNLPWTETLQAKWLLRRILTDLLLDVEMTSYFVIVDLVGYRGKRNDKGLLRGDYTPKAAYFAYRRLGALLDAASGRLEVEAAFEGDDDGRTVAAAFRRRGRLLLAYWHPMDLFEGFGRRTVRARIPTAEGLALERPLLADPLTGRVYRLDGAARTGGVWRFPALPLVDWPLLVADAALLE
ncbi:MAG: beta-glucosidase [Phycisphaerae bacterium]